MHYLLPKTSPPTLVLTIHSRSSYSLVTCQPLLTSLVDYLQPKTLPPTSELTFYPPLSFWIFLFICNLSITTYITAIIATTQPTTKNVTTYLSSHHQLKIFLFISNLSITTYITVTIISRLSTINNIVSYFRTHH